MADAFSSFPDLQELPDGARWQGAFLSWNQRTQWVYYIVLRWDADGTRHDVFAEIHEIVAANPDQLHATLAAAAVSGKSNTDHKGSGWKGCRDFLIARYEQTTDKTH